MTQAFQFEIDKYDAKNIMIKNKAVDMINVINEDKIDLELLKVYAFSGVPGQDDKFKGLRPLVWRLILGCLP